MRSVRCYFRYLATLFVILACLSEALIADTYGRNFNDTDSHTIVPINNTHTPANANRSIFSRVNKSEKNVDTALV